MEAAAGRQTRSARYHAAQPMPPDALEVCRDATLFAFDHQDHFEAGRRHQAAQAGSPTFIACLQGCRLRAAGQKWLRAARSCRRRAQEPQGTLLSTSMGAFTKLSATASPKAVQRTTAGAVGSRSRTPWRTSFSIAAGYAGFFGCERIALEAYTARRAAPPRS